MKVFYSETHRRHDPPFEVVDGGQRSPYLESPSRMDSILSTLRQTGWTDLLEPSDFGLVPILAVHSPAYLDFLAFAWQQWLAAYPENKRAPADAALLPATFALRHTSPVPTSILGRAGYYMMDLSAVIVEGTYPAALASANCALSAAHALLEDANPGSSVFALCRPPGHHAGPDYAAGYCFINNAAVAAQALSAAGQVALLDVDYHAGNGTQEIFYARGDVLTISIHADPASEYPYYSGYADERGTGAGLGFHHNIPLLPGIDDTGYLSALERALQLVSEFNPRYLVVSAGMDIWNGDAIGRFQITTRGISQIGDRISQLRLPTAIIMEGGYNIPALGDNMLAFLSPFQR